MRPNAGRQQYLAGLTGRSSVEVRAVTVTISTPLRIANSEALAECREDREAIR
jgi:hypothetical protein